MQWWYLNPCRLGHPKESPWHLVCRDGSPRNELDPSHHQVHSSDMHQERLPHCCDRTNQLLRRCHWEPKECLVSTGQQRESTSTDWILWDIILNLLSERGIDCRLIIFFPFITNYLASGVNPVFLPTSGLKVLKLVLWMQYWPCRFNFVSSK